MKRLNITNIQDLKNKRPIVCLTSYTASFAKTIESYIDILLVGDSLGTVIYGMKNTQNVTLELMKKHGRAVIKSTQRPFTIIDMPFQSFRNKKDAYNNAKQLLAFTSCQSIKIEAGQRDINIIEYLAKKKINVISHIGVRPQSFRDFSKIKILGRNSYERKRLINLALKLQDAGSSLIFLECIVEDVAKEISSIIDIPTIGIGSGVNCDGQVLVINDLLGFNSDFSRPKFVKTYLNMPSQIKKAVKKFSQEVRMKKFPSKKYSYK
ncbi:MAG: 3-methyl-2-oxobutanoate hydroxymethyltransferase [Pelagibacteraceae bacterium]|nr:3-methyl-2-oxobutanoate hydroxymethyltransferase [Pelagibacteraceae bacterium]PPR51676.1 MAG: 3-methyl-2-oxobutanoate hydroxymethyltransferase [Alphaproteobacteria bacterium MarineAlpha5_Bin10]|tara:strand:+ start:351 stop:1145 length:795 start_codon:yes stop_codon:yes gene_type:complete